jgi:hypothetical protein
LFRYQNGARARSELVSKSQYLPNAEAKLFLLIQDRRAFDLGDPERVCHFPRKVEIRVPALWREGSNPLIKQEAGKCVLGSVMTAESTLDRLGV